MIPLCPQARLLHRVALPGVENILCQIPQQTKSTDWGLHSNRWGLGRGVAGGPTFLSPNP